MKKSKHMPLTYTNFTKDTHMFHFVGESHMNYFYNYFVWQSYSELFHPSIAGSHVDKGYKNLFFYWTNFTFSQLNALQRVCNSSNNIEGKQFTIILQTGHWDLGLGLSTLRFLIAHDGFGSKLVAHVKRFLSDANACKGLQHFIWMTTLPYPFCAHNFHCKKKRGWRTSDNIRALNSFYTSQLLNFNVDPSIRLSIVDAFNIVYPRLFLAEEKEVVSVSHFFGTYLSGGVATSTAGLAMADAVREAISDHLLSTVVV